MIEATTRITVSPSVYLREFGDELVLLEFGKGEYYALDAIGAAVLRRLSKGAAVGEVVDAIVAEYDVARDVALADVIALIEQMKEQALIELFTA